MPEETLSPKIIKITQKIGWIALRPILKFFTGYYLVSQIDPKALKRPLIIVSNHTSLIDPPLLGTALPFSCPAYPIYFIAKDSLFTAPFLGGFLKFFGAFRAWRGEGLQKSLKEPKRILENGCSVVFFPQGKRYQEFLSEQGKPGAASLALDSGVPILPCAICSLAPFSWKNFFLRRYRVRIKIGRPFLLREKLAQNYVFDDNLEIATQIVMREIQKLLE